MWWKQTQIRMQTKPVRSKWTMHKSHGCFCILLTIQRKFKFWTGNSIWFGVRRVLRPFWKKKKELTVVPCQVTCPHHICIHFGTTCWIIIVIDLKLITKLIAVKKILGNRQLTVVFEWYIIFLKILGVIYVPVSSKHYLMTIYKCVGKE